MQTEYITLNSAMPDGAQLRRIVDAIVGGGLVVIPTETVYGVAASAAKGDGVRRLRELKGNSSGQSLTVHIARREECERFVPKIPPIGQRLVRKGWPGPLTLVFDVENPAGAPAFASLSSEAADAVYVNRTIGLRLPDHALTVAVLAGVDAPVIASSANVPGTAAPTSADEVRDHLDGRVDLVVDGGPTRYRKASTVVRLNGTGFHIVRQGVFDERTVRRLASLNIVFVCSGNTCRSPMAEGIFKQMLAKRIGCEPDELPSHGIIIRSTGTFGGSGVGAAAYAIEVCRKRGIDIRPHRSRSLTLEFIQPADYIFTMSRHHYDTVVSLAPDAAGKTSLLDPEGEIEDPIGGTLEDYEQVADRITRALEKRVHEVVS